MIIQESAENYLETILMLSQTMPMVRAIDIGNKMGFSKPSVSVAMKHFKEDGYIDIDDNGAITLLDKGRVIAERIYDRHNTISEMLISIGVDKQTALLDACKIEHDVSALTFDCIKRHFNEFNKNQKK